jgi:hypothetical protein
MGHHSLLLLLNPLRASVGLVFFLSVVFYPGRCKATIVSPFSVVSSRPGHIMCRGPALSANYGNGLNTRRFRTAQRLCGAGEVAAGRRNMACSCASPMSRPQCHEAEADPNLFHHEIIRSFCNQKCQCTDSPVQDQMMSRFDHEVAAAEATLDDLSDYTELESLGGVASGSGQPSCNGPCEWAESCLAAIPGGCTCTFRRGMHVPGGCDCELRRGRESDSLWFGSCRRSHDRRDLRASNAPCACNNTYVSVGCCGSLDGIIQEAPELKLGSLRLDLMDNSNVRLWLNLGSNRVT